MTVCVKEGEISFVPLGNFTSFIGHQTVEEYSSLERKSALYLKGSNCIRSSKI